MAGITKRYLMTEEEYQLARPMIEPQLRRLRAAGCRVRVYWYSKDRLERVVSIHYPESIAHQKADDGSSYRVPRYASNPRVLRED